MLYDYDIGGNLVSKKEYSYSNDNTDILRRTTPQHICSYEYSVCWKDMLIKFNGAELTRGYDSAGNPLNWFKTENGVTTVSYSMRWTHGRRLSEVLGISSYTYNDSGIRIGKTANRVTHKYYLEGSTIVAEDRIANGTTNRLTYCYGASGITGFYIITENIIITVKTCKVI